MKRTITRMITLLARKSQCYIGCALEKYRLTAAEQPFFMALQSYEGVTQEELTALVCVDKAATARAVRSLEEKGFLVRLQDAKDRRQNRIYPTRAARDLGPAVRGELLDFDRLLTRGISREELETAGRVLAKMEENFLEISGRRGKPSPKADFAGENGEERAFSHRPESSFNSSSENILKENILREQGGQRHGAGK